MPNFDIIKCIIKKKENHINSKYNNSEKAREVSTERRRKKDLFLIGRNIYKYISIK